MTRSGPHHTRMAKREFRQVLTEVRRLCGHLSISPSFVLDQSMVRMSAPSSLPPDRKSRDNAGGSPMLLEGISSSSTCSRKAASPRAALRMFRRFAAHGSWVKSAEKTLMYNSGLNFATKRGPVNTLRNTSTACWVGAIKRRETDVQAVWMKSGKPASQTPHGPSTMPKLSEPTRTRLTCLLGCNIADLR